MILMESGDNSTIIYTKYEHFFLLPIGFELETHNLTNPVCSP